MTEPKNDPCIGGHIGSQVTLFLCAVWQNVKGAKIQTKIKIEEINNENIVEKDIFIYNYGKSTYHYGAGYHCDK